MVILKKEKLMNLEKISGLIWREMTPYPLKLNLNT